MKVIGKNIVIKETIDKSTTTKGGLFLGEKHREDVRYKEGTIVIPGNDVNTVKKGDIIYFDKHAGFKLEVEKELYTIIKENDIVIVL